MSELSKMPMATVEQQAAFRKAALEREKELRNIVNAVAHVGVDFGYGKYELSEDDIMAARMVIDRES